MILKQVVPSHGLKVDSSAIPVAPTPYFSMNFGLATQRLSNDSALDSGQGGIALGLFLMPASLPGRALADALDWNHDVLCEADRLGYSEAWIGQHFTTPWEPIASPQQVIARALGHTSQIRLGTGVEVLYNSHPVRLALELAQLDHLARGRLMFGFGSGGTGTDFQLYGVDPRADQHSAMAREALSIILDCWKPGGPDRFDGQFWQVHRPAYDDRYVWHIEPYGDPRPRIALAGFMPRSASMRLAGEHGYIPLSFHVAPEHMSLHWQGICEGAAQSGRTPSRARWRHIRDIYVAESAAEARRAARDGCMGQFWDRHFMKTIARSGSLNLFKRPAAPAESAGDAASMIEHRSWYVGTPDQVVDLILEHHDITGGFGTLLQLGYDYADTGWREGWMRSMALLATEVMPAVNRRLAAARPAKAEVH
jgi:alkanesulfonate monooxygenase SsuD/methylene tetrahydromethanopterin reductase-like flavin-dependent oxidoreductase (luciferase family)